ncbi:MAG: MarR family winged helix-turn-helix transcriptional regulator [Candidatus Coproplasma sp.]
MGLSIKNLSLIAQSTKMYRDGVFGEMGITGVQVKYLLEVSNEEGVSQDMLAKRMMINKSNVARKLSELEENGFVKREQSTKDKRVMLVYLTEKGRAVIPKLHKENRRWSEILCEGLSEGETQQLSALLDKLVLNARHYLGCEL